MGMIINIDKALENRHDYNLLREPINDMLKRTQEAWERQNPIDLLFKRGKIDKFLETYTSSIGFEHAFVETGDYGVAPIFNTQGGFSAVYTSRTFQGGFIITQQVLEDGQYNRVKDDANNFIRRWHGDMVEYAMKAISSGFGKAVTFGEGLEGPVTRLLLKTADTTTGEVDGENKQPLFSHAHNVVRRKGMSLADAVASMQSNVFCVKEGDSYGIDLSGDDPGKIAKLADVINQVITTQENYKDDNNKYVGVLGAKKIIAPNDARLKGMLDAALSMDMLKGLGPNPAYQRATVETTPYLRDLPCCYGKFAAADTANSGIGFFIVDQAYNAENHGPEFTERLALTLNVDVTKNPYGIHYDARQRFDVNVASWRGITFVYLGSVEPTFNQDYELQADDGDVDTKTGWAAMTKITPIATIVKPVSVVGTVTTQTAE